MAAWPSTPPPAGLPPFALDMLQAEALAQRMIQAGDGEETLRVLQEWDSAAWNMNQDRFAHWIDVVMTLGKHERKTLSYNGAVRCLPGEAVHWIDPRSGVQYRDATNATYARALHSAVLYAAPQPWNIEELGVVTLGDIMEIGLAGAWQDASPANVCFRNRLENLIRVTERVEEKLALVFGGSTPQKWASRVDHVRAALGRQLGAIPMPAQPPVLQLRVTPMPAQPPVLRLQTMD